MSWFGLGQSFLPSRNQDSSASQYMKAVDVLERVQQRAVEMVKGLEHERAGTVQVGEEAAGWTFSK